MTRKAENWSNYGRVCVSRDERGRFVSWNRVIQEIRIPEKGYGGKRVAVYGYCMTNKGASSRRYEFAGNGRDLYRAIIVAHQIVPRERFVTVSARKFLDDPFTYGKRGYWIDRPEIDS